MPPAVSRMLTPDISFEIAKSSTVTWRAQPPFWTRFGALLKEAQSIGMPPTSVAGGNCADGNWLPMAGLCGPGSARLRRKVRINEGGSSRCSCSHDSACGGDCQHIPSRKHDCHSSAKSAGVHQRWVRDCGAELN